MKDELEDFVKANRSAFDDKEPSEKVWNKIAAGLPQGKQVSLFNSVWLWRAAAVIFMALSAYLYIAPQPKPTVKIAEANLREFSDVEDFYTRQISEKVDLISEFQRNEGLNGFTQDFKQLEAMYMVLKEEMKNHPSEKVREALVLNLLVRIDLLNQQLHKLDRASERKKQASV